MTQPTMEEGREKHPCCPHCCDLGQVELQASTEKGLPDCALCGRAGHVTPSLRFRYYGLLWLGLTGMVLGPLLGIAAVVVYEADGLIGVPIGTAAGLLARVPYCRLTQTHWLR